MEFSCEFWKKNYTVFWSFCDQTNGPWNLYWRNNLTMLHNRILTESKKEIPLVYMNEITIFELMEIPCTTKW